MPNEMRSERPVRTNPQVDGAENQSYTKDSRCRHQQKRLPFAAQPVIYPNYERQYERWRIHKSAVKPCLIVPTYRRCSKVDEQNKNDQGTGQTNQPAPVKPNEGELKQKDRDQIQRGGPFCGERVPKRTADA